MLLQPLLQTQLAKQGESRSEAGSATAIGDNPSSLRVELLQCGGHRLESKNGMGSFGEQVNGCPKTSHGHVHTVCDHTPIYVDEKVMVGRGLY